MYANFRVAFRLKCPNGDIFVNEKLKKKIQLKTKRKTVDAIKLSQIRIPLKIHSLNACKLSICLPIEVSRMGIFSEAAIAMGNCCIYHKRRHHGGRN